MTTLAMDNLLGRNPSLDRPCNLLGSISAAISVWLVLFAQRSVMYSLRVFPSLPQAPPSKDLAENSELEDLWKEMEVSMHSVQFPEIPTDAQAVVNKSSASDGKACKHDYVLNEQIGTICRLCNSVGTEIRYILPPQLENLGRMRNMEYEQIKFEVGRFTRISPFANRLSSVALPAVQRLRCLANYEALKFSNPIKTFVDRLVPRERGWRGKFTKSGRVIRPGAIRMNGKCPLTPLELEVVEKFVGLQEGIPRNDAKTLIENL